MEVKMMKKLKEWLIGPHVVSITHGGYEGYGVRRLFIGGPKYFAYDYAEKDPKCHWYHKGLLMSFPGVCIKSSPERAWSEFLRIRDKHKKKKPCIKRFNQPKG